MEVGQKGRRGGSAAESTTSKAPPPAPPRAVPETPKSPRPPAFRPSPPPPVRRRRVDWADLVNSEEEGNPPAKPPPLPSYVIPKGGGQQKAKKKKKNKGRKHAIWWEQRRARGQHGGAKHEGAPAAKAPVRSPERKRQDGPKEACLLKDMLCNKAFVKPCSVQEVVFKASPGAAPSLTSFPSWPSSKAATFHTPDQAQQAEQRLVDKLRHLVSSKGGDLLLAAETEDVPYSQRLRQSIPAFLWKWKDVAGWRWRQHDPPEQINKLELRAMLTAVKWRVLKRKGSNTRFLHLVDSLVCLYAVNKGRSSSRKLMPILRQLNTYCLAFGLSPLLSYVSTDQNPADRPSRRDVFCKHRASR